MALDNAPRAFLDESPAAPLLRWLLEPLDTWLSDPATEDVAINRPNEAWIRARGGWTRTPIPLDIEELEEIAILAGSLRKQGVGALAPLCATELPGGERLQICLPPSVPHGTVSLTIRKPGRDDYRLSLVSGQSGNVALHDAPSRAIRNWWRGRVPATIRCAAIDQLDDGNGSR
jgi:type IV secretory pathway ATPase VirB11/archaellum biosynthesis ATPase